MIWDQLSLQIAFLLAYMLRNGLSNPYSHLIYCNVAFILVVIDAGVLLLFESLKNVLKGHADKKLDCVVSDLS